MNESVFPVRRSLDGPPRILGRAALVALAAAVPLVVVQATPASAASSASAVSRATTKKAKKKAAPKVRISVATPKPVAVDRSVTVHVKVANGTRKRLSGATLTIKPAKGVTVKVRHLKKGKLKLATVKARRARSVTVKLTPTTKAAATTRTRLTLTRGRRTVARGSITVRVRAANPLVGRLFWRSRTVPFHGIAYSGYYFADGKFAYRGLPSDARPVCTAATAQGDDDGCVAYTYDAATGALSVDGKAGKVDDAHDITVDGMSFGEAELVPPGSRLDATGTSGNSSGNCPGAGCISQSGTLTLRGDGQFARATLTSGSVFSALSPDAHGTYDTDAAGRLILSYADGHVDAGLFAVQLNPSGAYDANFGFLFAGEAYFRLDS